MISYNDTLLEQFLEGVFNCIRSFLRRYNITQENNIEIPFIQCNFSIILKHSKGNKHIYDKLISNNTINEMESIF